MLSHDYLHGILNKYTADHSGAQLAAQSIYPIIQIWGGNLIEKSSFSGSLAKGTAISLTSDADIFISLSSSTPSTLQEIHNTLHTAFVQRGYAPRKQNVSISIEVNGYKVDLVPGKRQNQQDNYHSLFRHKLNTWTQTNVDVHITHVKNSNRIREIRLAKIWKALHGLDFPSFYLEMLVIDALSGYKYDDLPTNFCRVLEFIRDELPARQYIDPANTNNIISNDLTESEKNAIAYQANESRAKRSWGEIVW